MQLYPEKFLERFLTDGIRPDGRPLARCRPATIAESAVPSTADASALVKLGNTTALAGIKLELMNTLADYPDQGRLAVRLSRSPDFIVHMHLSLALPLYTQSSANLSKFLLLPRPFAHLFHTYRSIRAGHGRVRPALFPLRPPRPTTPCRPLSPGARRSLPTQVRSPRPDATLHPQGRLCMDSLPRHLCPGRRRLRRRRRTRSCSNCTQITAVTERPRQPRGLCASTAALDRRCHRQRPTGNARDRSACSAADAHAVVCYVRAL